MAQEYPEDEFDAIAARRKVHGTHRPQRSNTRWWIALVAILIAAPLAGWGIIQLISADRPAREATTTATASDATETTDGGGTTGEGPAESTEPVETGPELPAVDLDSSVLVLNGASIRGFAASNQELLVAEGFTDVEVDNYDGTTPEVSTVFYAAESDEGTAASVATTLGIPEDNVILAPSATGDYQIVVVLRADLS
ncbi:LytR C-terminal domain-containing protein [Actinobaculum sp. 313]|uniref:LytR C-terminal domain-containing protein n=1 Tax=Actinobaculum sp. 313 TaxID=2495645 RepID=UPI000D52A5D8|nr:LytR C-terminal domain-containing protein [Actinobaculum sp. 313]AWE41653.1 hypothetical protein DDD63_01515 [Actinobaculum sp. 313]